MRSIILDPQGAQIAVEFNDQGDLRIAGACASIIEVSDESEIRVQTQVQVGGSQKASWTEVRTSILSGTQFWDLVSATPVADAEQAGLHAAKQHMVEARRREHA